MRHINIKKKIAEKILEILPTIIQARLFLEEEDFTEFTWNQTASKPNESHDDNLSLAITMNSSFNFTHGSITKSTLHIDPVRQEELGVIQYNDRFHPGFFINRHQQYRCVTESFDFHDSKSLIKYLCFQVSMRTLVNLCHNITQELESFNNPANFHLGTVKKFLDIDSNFNIFDSETRYVLMEKI